MKTLFPIFLGLSLAGCASLETGDIDAAYVPSWQIVFENDESGAAVAGSKDALIEAVREGQPVRVYTGGRRIEHASDAVFLSIWDGEVFAQLPEIQSQRPGLDPVRIEFRAPGEKWRAIIGTNGFFTGYIDGGDPNIRQRGARWFVYK